MEELNIAYRKLSAAQLTFARMAREQKFVLVHTRFGSSYYVEADQFEQVSNLDSDAQRCHLKNIQCFKVPYV